jgi:hypothetical protein
MHHFKPRFGGVLFWGVIKFRYSTKPHLRGACPTSLSCCSPTVLGVLSFPQEGEICLCRRLSTQPGGYVSP